MATGAVLDTDCLSVSLDKGTHCTSPFLQFLPSDVLEHRDSLLMRDLTRREERTFQNSMSKYFTNVRYTEGGDLM